LRVAFLIHEIGRSGGAQTILRYARALEGAELVVTGPAVELPREHDGVPVRRLADARAESWDCAIATWWTTAGFLWEVGARARLVLLQSIESRFYREEHFTERFAAEQVLTLPVGYVVVAGWMRDVLAELRPDAPCVVVRNGIDKAVFRAREAAASADAAASRPPLRVLVDGQPSQWFKGVRDAVAAARGMSEPAEVTVVAGDPSATGGVEDARIVGGLDPAGMAALYAEHDVLLKLSRVESLGLAPIEAFHVGMPAVVAPYTGHEEYLVHGRNGLIVGHDDVPGTARALDRLARDRELLGRLAEGALATAASWPSAETASAEFASALTELADGPRPDAAAALANLQRAQRRWLELGREHVRQREWAERELRGAVAWHEDAYAEAKEHVEELNERLRIAHEEGVALTEQLEELRSSRAYRAAVSLRKLKPGGG
jgi:glycosyltransferase involved in cell wall biosynthesis